MLELIVVLSAVLRKYSDLVVVGALLIVNAVLSFAQEHRAAGVVQTLRRRLQVRARVLRDASWQLIPARDLVPGDIVRVRPGDIIPADIKLLAGTVSVDQSVLTGESMDADKASGDVLSSGAVVRRGEGNAVVMLTGAQTYFGRTTELVQAARPKLHVEAVVAKVVRWLFVIVGALLGVVAVLPSNKPETWKIGGFIIVSVVLGIAIVAEALFALYVGWTEFGLSIDNNALYTFSFLTLLYLAAFSIVSVRERRWFWTTMPSATLIAALTGDVLVGTVLTYVGLPGLAPLPWWQTLTLLAYAVFACLVVNDPVKVVLTRWLVPRAGA